MNYHIMGAMQGTGRRKLLAVGKAKNKIDARKQILNFSGLHEIETVEYGRKTYTIGQVYREF